MAGEFDYDRDISINKHELDREWVQQANLMWKYAKAEADAEFAMDKAKERLDLVKADLDKKMRGLLASADKKPTEAVIASAIIQHEDCRTASSEYLEAKHVYNIFRAAVKAISQRKDSLENLVWLFGKEYFSTPQNRTQEGSEGLRKSTRQSIRDRLRKDKDGD
jgi:hypothetical protein